MTYFSTAMDVQDFLVQGEGHEEDKREAWQLFQQAYERQMKGELEEAVTHYKKSIETHPTAEAYTFLGWTYSFMGRLDDAIEECHKAIAQDPDCWSFARRTRFAALLCLPGPTSPCLSCAPHPSCSPTSAASPG